MHDAYFHCQFFLYIYNFFLIFIENFNCIFLNISLFLEIKFTLWEAVHDLLVSLNFLEREWIKAAVTETNHPW
jgi:hypothetical protein